MAHSTTVAAGSRILPVGTAAFFGRRLSEAAGLALIAGAGLGAMAIVTYAPGDISLNTAAPAGARNALGPYGSLLADVLVQGYGIASFLPVLALAAWGWRLLRKRANPRPWLRLILLMAAVSLLAAGASVLTTPERWPLHTGLGGAVGALAFGTASIPPVDKIVGPGNMWVATAKRQVFGHVGIDTIAGPSEVLVVADGGCPASWIAADLLAQAEHDEAAQSILIALSHDYADAVETEIGRHLETLPRAATARASWERHGACIVVRDLDEAPALIDAMAPEHLQLAVADPEALAARVRHAGAVFLGALTPEAIGDYVGGPNHVLPTSRTARFASGLGVMDFMKRTTLLGCGADSLAAIGPAAAALAAAEGLDAHGLSVSLRLDG